MTKNKKICPNCGSENVIYSSSFTGESQCNDCSEFGFFPEKTDDDTTTVKLMKELNDIKDVKLNIKNKKK